MIKVNYGSNVRRDAKMVNPAVTLRHFLEEVGIDYTKGQTSLDGAPLAAGDLDKTFAQMGVTEKCYLLNVVKADNA